MLQSKSRNIGRAWRLWVFCFMIIFLVYRQLSMLVKAMDALNSPLMAEVLVVPSSSLPHEDNDLETTVCVWPKEDRRAYNRSSFSVTTEEEENAACRVLIENREDYHYEVIESTILRYPLPWDRLNCSGYKTRPIIFDVALTKHVWFSYERDGYEQYFNSQLKGTLRDRDDGTKARIANLVSWRPYEREDYAAKVGVTCPRNDPKAYVNEGTNHFCVLHNDYSKNDELLDETTKQQSCWLNPMQPCFFLPSVFPQYPTSLCSRRNDPTINLCTVGDSFHRNHHLLAEAMAQLRPQDVKVIIHHRSDEIPIAYNESKVANMVKIVHTRSFLDYQGSISKCDALLPLLDPKLNKGYFPHGGKKLSGSLSQVIGYELPTVMHEELHAVYVDHLKGPSMVHDNTTQSFVKALGQMIEYLRITVPDEIERSCADPTVVRGKKCFQNVDAI